MNLPDGYSEQDLLNILNAIAHQLAHTFTFGYYSAEDIEQEIRVIALEGLPRFEPERGVTLYTFLRRHVHNRLCNLKRDKYYRRNAPCNCCGLDTPESSWCPKYKKWILSNAAKRNLVDSYAGEEYYEVVSDNADIPESLSQVELRREIDLKLPASFRTDYRRLLEGSHIPKKRLISLLSTLREILGVDHGST